MSHPSHDLFENRKQFQLERLILFSDAVFAIAITLLVIEIRVPQIEHSSDTIADLSHALKEKGPEFFGFILSFAVIGQFWTNHHRLFGQVNGYNNTLLWLNLHMLFWIVLVPFTSGLNSHYGGLHMVWTIYSFNLFMIALALVFLYRYVSSPKRNLSDLAHDAEARKTARYRGVGVALVFLGGGLIALLPEGSKWVFYVSHYIYFLIPVVLILVNRASRRRIRRAAKK